MRHHLTAIVVLSSLPMIWAQGKSGEVRDLNNKVLQLHAQAQQATPAQAAQVQSQAGVVLRQRAGALKALIVENPKAALGLAFAGDLLADLAERFPAAAGSLEERGTWSGVSEHIILDDPQRSVRAADIRIRTANGKLQIYATEGEPGCMSGNTLTVDGVKVENVVAAGSTSVQNTQVAAAASCSTLGVQNTAVILVRFPTIDLPASVTAATMWDTFFAPTGRSVNTYWSEASYGKASAAGNVFGPYTLDRTYTCDEYDLMRTAAIAKADADVNFQNYTRIFVVFPNPGSCAWAGLGMLGCGSMTSADGTFQASTSWLRADQMGTRDNGVKLATHEGGHNLTLHHAASRDFGAEALGPVGAAGTLSEYGDPFNTMGSWNFGHYGAPHKAMIGWLNATNVLTTETNGSYSVQPLGTPAAGVQALKIRRGTGNNAWLWVEYRQPTGQYESTLSSQVFTGGLVHYADSTTGTRTHLLDYTTATASFSDAALVGSWTDPYSNVTVAISGGGTSALSVTTNYGPVPCVAAAPSIAISPANPTVESGKTVSYTVSVTNADTGGCAARTYNLTSTLPDLMTTTFGQSVLTLTPGQAVNTTMTKSVPVGFTPGTYAVNATVGDATNSTTALANITVKAPPEPIAVTVTVSPATIALRSTAAVQATVTNRFGPVSGVAVTFRAVRTNGNTTTKSATTNSAGVAVWSYKPSQRGTFTISATATASGTSATSTPVTLIVQ